MSQIEVARVGLGEYEKFLANSIRGALENDAFALRSIEIKPYIPTTAEEADTLIQTKGLLIVRGFLSLDNEVGRMFDFTMEAGLTETEDNAIAEQLAATCVVCIRQMKASRKNPNIRYSMKQSEVVYQ